MSKEFIKENDIAIVRYSNQYECLADKSKDTRAFLDSTPCKKAKVPGEFAVLRRSKRGLKYIFVYCNDYNIEFESGDCEEQRELTDKEILKFFNPEILEAKQRIENIKDRRDLSIRELNKIYKKSISRARNIEYFSEFNLSKFYNKILPDFMKTNSCRTKVFLTPNLRSKIGG